MVRSIFCRQFCPEMTEYYLPTLKDQLKAKSVTKSQPEMVAALKAASFDVAAAFKALQSRARRPLLCVGPLPPLGLTFVPGLDRFVKPAPASA